MSASDIATIGGAVMLLTQIIKRASPVNGLGVYIAALLSVVAVALWVVSAPVFPPSRTDAWSIFAGWVAVFATAMGLYQGASLVTGPPSSASGESNVLAGETPPSDPPAPEAPPASVPRGAVLTEPVVEVPAPRKRAGATAPAWPRAGQEPGGD